MDAVARRLYKLMICYALIMLLVFLVIGVLYREYSKALVGGDAGDIVVIYYLSLSHGHVLITGAIIPSILLFLTYMVEKTRGKTPNYRSLWKAFIIYIIGSLSMTSLLIYKGMGIIYYYTVYSSMIKADEALFLGSHALREALYGTAHLLLGIGIAWYVVSLLRRLSSQ